MKTISVPHTQLRRVYVWELPVRIYHWLNVVVLLVLIVTGYFIGNPLGIQSASEASGQYLFGTIRFIHFTAAYIFLFNFIFRIYWGFRGNKYANWRNFIPTNKIFFENMRDVLRVDIFLKRNADLLSVGHNSLAGLSYFFTFLAFLLQIFTGFGLYASMSNSWFAGLFSWVPGLLGGDFMVRNIHHSAMWFFIIFSIVHIYLVLYHEYVEARGEVSSMVGGWKFIREEVFHKHIDLQKRFFGEKKDKEEDENGGH